MRASSRAVAAALLAAAAGAAGTRVAERAGALRHPLLAEPRSLRGWAAEGLAVRKVLGDLGYIAMLHHVGASGYALDRGREFSRLAGRATDADPRLVPAYAFGGGALMWLCRAPEPAIRLLEKGIVHNPGDARLRLYLAAFVYRRADELHQEIAALERVALDPQAPGMARRILANAYEKALDFRRAAALWRLVLATTDDPADRAWAEEKLIRRGRLQKPK